MKILKDKVAKLSFVALLITITAAMFYAPTASAHGEKSQAAFMRMRTIHWFDLNWSKEEVVVNDTMTISGRYFIFEHRYSWSCIYSCRVLDWWSISSTFSTIGTR
jgi:methane/ammonia monooxygenase subunit B